MPIDEEKCKLGQIRDPINDDFTEMDICTGKFGKLI